MSVKITLAVAALGIILASQGNSRDVPDAQRHVGALDLERSYAVPRHAEDLYYASAQYFRQCSDSPARC
jgi:hypothetical protein